MIFACYTSEKTVGLKQSVSIALAVGAAKHGDRVVFVTESFQEVIDHVDGAILLGVGSNKDHKTTARTVFDSYINTGKYVILVDKGYTRPNYFRVSINNFQPVDYLMKIRRPSDRLEVLNLKPKPYSRSGTHILFDGVSQKYCSWHKLSNQLEWGISIVKKIREVTDRPIIYRLRPTNNEPLFIEGTEAPLSLEEDLARAHVVVSHAGNIGWEAILAGKPHFAIGPSIARPISEIDWNELDIPILVPNSLRNQWLANVAYCQWNMYELTSGQAWGIIKEQMKLCISTKRELRYGYSQN